MHRRSTLVCSRIRTQVCSVSQISPKTIPLRSFSSLTSSCSSPVCRVHSSISELSQTQRKHLLKFRTGSACIPKREKVAMGNRAVVDKETGYGGEDAYLCLGSCSSHFIGVADGVSEWANLRIDAGLWSRSLLEGVQTEIRREVTDVLDPLQLMWSSYETNINNKVLGSCTACFLSLASVERELSTANLGNSGYMLLRLQGGTLKMLHKSETQEQNFGCPFQLGHHLASNKPSQAAVARHLVLPGDILVVGSDGLFDNLSFEEITDKIAPVLMTRWEQRKAKVVRAVEKFEPEEPLASEQCATLACSPAELANALAKEAFGASLDKKRVTPFGLSYTKEMNMVWNGGKQDDITVVVGFVELDISL